MPHDEILCYQTDRARFLITRAERYRLARRHGAADAEARRLAYGRADAPAPPPDHPVRPGTFAAHELAPAFDAEGRSIAGAVGPGTIPPLT